VAVAKWKYTLLRRAVIQSSNRSATSVGLLLEHPVAVTAYYHLSWWSIIRYAIAAVVAVTEFALAFPRLVVTTRRNMGA
jgi:hypothetical protein